MSKVITAEYDAKENVFRLDEPPEGVADHEKVQLAVVPADSPAPSILAFRGIFSGENGEDFAAKIEEMFPIEK